MIIFTMMAEAGQTGGNAITESIATRSGLKLQVQKRANDRQVELLLQAQTRKSCILHWGIRGKGQAGWKVLPQSAWPEGTKPAGTDAMQTPFRKQNGESRIEIALTPGSAPELIEFALFFPEESKWDNNGRRNYQIAVPGPGRSGVSPAQALRSELGSQEVVLERVFDIEDIGQLAVAVVKEGDSSRRGEADNLEASDKPADQAALRNSPTGNAQPTDFGACKVLLLSDLPGQLALHWGIARRSPH